MAGHVKSLSTRKVRDDKGKWGALATGGNGDRGSLNDGGRLPTKKRLTRHRFAHVGMPQGGV